MSDCERHADMLENHETRLTDLEIWKARFEGAIAALNTSRSLLYAMFTASLSLASAIGAIYFS